jgi:Protein of unknown function (DUF664)
VTDSDALGGRSDERALLNGFLDWQRAVVARKVEGLSTNVASTVMTSTGLSPLGVVAHLAAVEVGWFSENFAGEPWDPTLETHGSFQLRPDDSVESVVAEYRACCDRSRAIVGAFTSLDELSALTHDVYGRVSLRWVLVHMIEETARHAGHLDILREAIDGQTGD